MKPTTPASLWFVAAFLAIAGGFASTARAADSGDRPSIVFVLFDDMGRGQPPCYDAKSALRTPNLDKLAGQGMRFLDAHSAAAVCTPTRYGVLTGRYPMRIGQFGVLTTYSAPIIPPSRTTVASLLKAHGYRTACVGKWHLGLDWVEGRPGTEKRLPVGTRLTAGPNALGFDYFCGFTHARNIGSIIEQDRVIDHVEPVENQPLMIRKALAWLEQQKAGEPFFLYFPMCPPHTPVVPAPEYVGQSGAQDVVGNDPKYGDWVYQGDAMLGQIMDALDRLNLADNTLLIATADNGAAHRAYAPLRDHKGSIYEGGHRVPMVVRWPGHVKAGSTWQHTVCLNDLLATAAEIVGAELPPTAGEDSVSLLPAILGTSDAPTRATTVHQSPGRDLALRQGPWKLVYHASGQRELFNLDDDLSETNDVLSAHPDVAARLTELLEHTIATGRSTPGPAQANDVKLSLPLKGQAKKKKR